MQVAAGIASADTRDRNDCSVRAYANAFGVSYERAFSVTKQYGRKRRNGSMKHPAVMEMLDARATRFKTYDFRHKFALKTRFALYEIPRDGVFYVLIKGHAFAVINGVIFDQPNVSSERWYRVFGRRPIMTIWQVPTCAPVQLSLPMEETQC